MSQKTKGKFFKRSKLKKLLKKALFNGFKQAKNLLAYPHMNGSFLN